MAIERLKTTQQSTDPKDQKPRIPMGKEGTRKYQKRQAEAAAKTITQAGEEIDTDGKVYRMSELIAQKREVLESIAAKRNINGHTMKNKEAIAIAILEDQGDDLTEGGLNPRQEMFCQLYASDKEFFGHGTEAYIEAFDINMSSEGAYQSAAAAASRLLKNVKVFNRINELLTDVGFNDANLDKQLLFWAMQKDNGNVAVAAIREYNKVKKRVDDRGDGLGQGNTFILNQQNNQIHFTNPKARKIVEGFDNWLLENTKAPQEEKEVANA